MGAGYHGGFGITSGVSYRIGAPVEPTTKSLNMALSPIYYSNVIAKKYNIHLRGSGKIVRIEFDPSLGPGQFGRTNKKEPNVIYLGQDAFSSEEQLANTIAHELRHAREYLKTGDSTEEYSYNSGNALAAYIRGEK